MKKHPADIVALLFGIIFAVTGASFIVYETTDSAVSPAWIAGGGLILAGVVALVVTLVRGNPGSS